MSVRAAAAVSATKGRIGPYAIAPVTVARSAVVRRALRRAEDDDRSREDCQGAHGRANGTLPPSDQRLVVGWLHQRPVPSRVGSSPLPERRDSFTATFCSAEAPLLRKAVHRTRRRAA